jgi:hypothetical protein
MTVETDAGRIVLAGQAVGGATDYSRARYAWELRRHGTGEEVKVPEWIERRQDFDRPGAVRPRHHRLGAGGVNNRPVQ